KRDISHAPKEHVPGELASRFLPLRVEEIVRVIEHSRWTVVSDSIRNLRGVLLWAGPVGDEGLNSHIFLQRDGTMSLSSMPAEGLNHCDGAITVRFWLQSPSHVPH